MAASRVLLTDSVVPAVAGPRLDADFDPPGAVVPEAPVAGLLPLLGARLLLVVLRRRHSAAPAKPCGERTTRARRQGTGAATVNPSGMRLRLLLPLVLAVLALTPAVPAVAAPPPAPAGADAVAATGLDPWLAGELERVPADTQLRVLVRGRDLAGATDAVAALGMSPVTTFDRVQVAVAWGTPEQVRGLVDQPGVVFVEGDRPYEYTMETSHKATRGELARTTQLGADGQPLDGRGVSVAILDSGVDGTHPMFDPDGLMGPMPSRVRVNLKFACAGTQPVAPFPNGAYNDMCFAPVAGNDSDTPSAGGHGTHVAGTAAGGAVTTSDGRKLIGAAPGATVVSLSIGQSLSVFGSAAGLNWVLENHRNPCGDNSCPPIKATNHSYGPPGGGPHNPNSTDARIQELLVSAGVVTAWAAGNDGDQGEAANATNPPGQSPTPGVLMVAAYNDGDTGTRDGVPSTFTSRGRAGQLATYPDISAPGTNIHSACRPALAVCRGLGESADPNYGIISGTSMATPHMVGIVAQLFQAKPALTAAQVEHVLEDTAHQFAAGGPYVTDLADRNPSGHTTSQTAGHGLVDVAAAVATVQGLPVPAAPPAGPACDPLAPQVTDPSGDATAVLVDTELRNEPSLDLLRGQLATVPGSSDVEFSLQVADLPAATGARGFGEVFDFNFTYDGATYYVQPRRNQAGVESYVLGRFGATGRQTLATLSGSFVPATDKVTVRLPAAAIATAVPGEPVIRQGSVFAGFEIVSRYDLTLLVPNADTATGACPFAASSDRVVEVPLPAPVIPEVPVAALLPLAGLGLLAATMVRRRRTI